VDIESSFHVSDNFKVFLNAAFIDAEYDAFPDAAQTTPVPTGGNALSSADASGNKIMRTPDLTLNTGFNYRIPTDLGDFDVQVTYYYNDGFYWHPENRLKEDAYHLVNSTITWSRMGSPFSVSLWGRNLLDEEYATYVETGALADQYSAAPPLTFGIALRVQY
jgi:iron complex outermembrane receptor protein